ncbi:hypothetical protein [Acidovorax carolinensis]|uniref:hypothetical protein n=1 Tax=Acidovorax carolinensis TaxID=553814 RepID=UPI0012FF8C3E|nr:hypothetical protein [Acidovorax carolinensis]
MISNTSSSENTACSEVFTDSRVHVSKQALELYLRDGCPTGLLLSSVALLKGQSIDSIAKASGFPARIVDSIFKDRLAPALKRSAIKRIAGALGIDLVNMRFAAGQVHAFDLRRIPVMASSKRRMQIKQAVGILARGARIARVQMGGTLVSALSREHVYVAQTEVYRAIFVGRPGAFSPEMIPSAQWVCGTKKASVVRVSNNELVWGLHTSDITESEFDELFLGAEALIWDDIRTASRANGVSKQEIINFIQSRGEEIENARMGDAQRIANEDPPFLRLVDSLPEAWPRSAVG